VIFVPLAALAQEKRVKWL